LEQALHFVPIDILGHFGSLFTGFSNDDYYASLSSPSYTTA
jgi:hypothetical protein